MWIQADPGSRPASAAFYLSDLEATHWLYLLNTSPHLFVPQFSHLQNGRLIWRIRAPQWPPSTQARESLPASRTIHIKGEGLASLAAVASGHPCVPSRCSPHGWVTQGPGSPADTVTGFLPRFHRGLWLGNSSGRPQANVASSLLPWGPASLGEAGRKEPGV